MQDWERGSLGDQPKEQRVWKVWECCLILQSLFLRDFVLGGIDDSGCAFSSISKSLIKEWICGANLGALTGWAWEARAGRECTSKGGQECSGERPQMWKLSPSGETFPRFYLEFCHQLPSSPKGRRAKTWYRGTQPHPWLINHGKPCRKSGKNSCTPQNPLENAAGVISILLLDKLLWKTENEWAFSLPTFGCSLLSKWMKMPTLMPLSCHDTF